MLRRSIAVFIGLMTAANGLLMMADGQRWYASTPGVPASGPYNSHFVVDIGAAFLVAGLGLLFRGWRQQYWPAAAAGSGFLLLHAAIHGLELLHSPDAPATTLVLTLIAVAAIWASLPHGRGLKGGAYV
ncbi:hypothetical protein [Pseudomaricurvus sp. HS19]|uniref:hypothetical protein n=1 Tax=Pseudomaricurvus sp. HS19 TaxID=2692626 RepID=UPI00136DD777|nr:hypothetical protein [Pseudomaricurvus sp. HS19]MYM63042.1 hypothetical protein [Pseudomaricurvus sp. HS19]